MQADRHCLISCPVQRVQPYPIILLVMAIPPQLFSQIKKCMIRPVSPELDFLAEVLVEKYRGAVRAVLFYGSCLQRDNPFDGLVDLYVLVDSYGHAHGMNLSALANCLLPPNVYYYEGMYRDRTIRVKYAVISLSQFRKACSMRWFHSYFWGRFCQPSAIIYVKDRSDADDVVEACASAVITFLTRTIPCITPEFTVSQVWQYGLGLAYGAELRPERPDRVEALFSAGSHWFMAVTGPALEAVPFGLRFMHGVEPCWRASIDGRTRNMCRLGWFVRSVQGKILSVLRLMKAAFTFRGGVDYAVYKIERHSGVALEVSPFLRRHPLLSMLVFAIRIFRRGGVR